MPNLQYSYKHSYLGMADCSTLKALVGPVTGATYFIDSSAAADTFVFRKMNTDGTVEYSKKYNIPQLKTHSAVITPDEKFICK